LRSNMLSKPLWISLLTALQHLHIQTNVSLMESVLGAHAQALFGLCTYVVPQGKHELV